MSERRPSQYDGELAALRHQREMESLSVSPGVNSVLDATANFADMLGLPGAGLFRKALKSGQTPVETLLEQLETAAIDEIRRIWNCIEGQQMRLREFEGRLQSQEAQSVYLSAIFHGLRTSDPKKQSRLGILTINCIYANDVEPESLDEMMRAAVELKEADLMLLSDMYEMQSPFMRTDQWLNKQINERWNILSGYWQRYWDQNQARYRGLEGERLMGSFGKLEYLGLIAPGPNRSSASSPVASCYLLLPDGMRFYERHLEIAPE
jgi:hypothetical protein